MNIPDYICAARDSAKLYYSYLKELHEKHPERVPHIPVIEKKRVLLGGSPVHLLKLRYPLFSTDALVLVIDGKEYPDGVKFLGWNEESLYLIVKTEDHIRDHLHRASADQVFLISDMSFLVKRIGDWYASPVYPYRISLPSSASTVKPPVPENFREPPSEEQRNALNGIFEHPLTYIWGAPGTGKTKYVLAYALMTYLKAGKPVLICAPTNNAVDQTLLGVLDILKHHEVKIDRILRLGTPDQEIVRRYPQVCEERDIVVKHSRCVLEIRDVTAILSVRNRNAAFQAAYRDLLAIAETTQTRYLAYKQVQHERTSAEMDLNAVRLEVIGYVPVVDRNSNDMKLARQKTQSLSIRLLGAVGSRKQAEAQEKLANAEMIYQKSVEKLRQLNEEKQQHTARLERLTAELKKLSSPETLLSEFRKSCERYPEAGGLLPELSVDVLNRLEEICSDYFEKNREEEPDSLYREQSIEELTERLRQLEEEKKLYEKAGSSLKNALIVAATADTLFSRYDTFEMFGVTFHHVFMDESAYCPLIKSMIAFSFGCPVTLLGDHRQLPPVCEMDFGKLPDKFKQLAVLWHQSAVRSENVFTHSLESLYLDYRDDADIVFETTKQYTLNHTYRFGEKIAEILAEEVYTPDFHGNRYADTSITVVHAPDSTRNGASYSEAAAIRDFILKHSIRNYAILVPYKAQLHCVREVFPQADEEQRVMTIHSSQGREWDTVFLSVTDTVRTFFMNSKLQKSNGLQIINTAVSRAKRELVIVCDYNLWICREDQLIGKIIKNADEIINSPED